MEENNKDNIDDVDNTASKKFFDSQIFQKYKIYITG